MVSRFALIAAASLITAVAAAQTPPGAPGAPAPDMDRIALLLDLDETQKTEVERILEEQHAQINTARAQAQASGERPSREEVRAAHERYQLATMTKLQGVLTPLQLKKFEALMQRPPR